jgi:hypothetical protein
MKYYQHYNFIVTYLCICVYICVCVSIRGPGNSVGIVTGYGMDSLEI